MLLVLKELHNEMVLLSTQNIMFKLMNKKIITILQIKSSPFLDLCPLLCRPMYDSHQLELGKIYL